MLSEKRQFVSRAFYFYKDELYYSSYMDAFGSCPFDTEMADEHVARTHDPIEDEF